MFESEFLSYESDSLKMEEVSLVGIAKAIKTNQSLQQQAGHHGVPLMVYKDKTFFGQDKFDEFKELLLQEGMQVPARLGAQRAIHL